MKNNITEKTNSYLGMIGKSNAFSVENEYLSLKKVLTLKMDSIDLHGN